MDVDRQQGDLGGQTVERIRAVMQVDDEWSFDIPGGFAWWGAGLRQRIWSERVQAPDAPHIWRVCVETDFLRDVAPTGWGDQILSALNGRMALGAFVHDPEVRTIRRFLAAYVYDEMAELLYELLANGAALSAAECEALADEAATWFEGTPDRTPHPVNGRRPDVDDMLGVRETFAAVGSGPSRLGESEFERAADFANAESGAFANADTDGATLEFIFGSESTSIVLLDGGGSPEDVEGGLAGWLGGLGVGLRSWLVLPTDFDADTATKVAASLNRREAAGESNVHCFGAWAAWTASQYHPWLGAAESDDRIALGYAAFFPNMACAPGLATNVGIWSGARSRWAASVLVPGETPGNLIEVVMSRLRPLMTDDREGVDPSTAADETDSILSEPHGVGSPYDGAQAVPGEPRGRGGPRRGESGDAATAGMVEGVGLIERLQRDLQVDDCWAVGDGAVRTWWLGTLPVRVWASPQPQVQGGPWVRLHASTVVATGVRPSDAVYQALAQENATAIMSALVLDAATQELSLVCQATFDTSRSGGARLDLFKAALAYQAGVGEILGTLWPLPAGERPRTAHPTSGYRAEPSDLSAHILQTTRMVSDEIPTITQAELHAIDAFLQDYVLWSISGSGRLSLEVNAGSDTPRIWISMADDPGSPWGPETAEMARSVVRRVAKDVGQDPTVHHQAIWGSLEGPDAPRTGAMRVSTEDEHPIVGKGLMMLLLLPGRYPATQSGRLVNSLNLLEGGTPVPLTQLGAWAARETGESWQIAYSSFIPTMFSKDMDPEARVAMVGDLAGEIALRALLATSHIGAQLAHESV